MIRIGLIGDLHGKSTLAHDWIRKNSPDFCLQVGDYWSYEQEWKVPVYWIFGNHENFKYVNMIANGDVELHENNIWLRGGVVNVEGINIMALPGLPQSRSTAGPAGFSKDIYQLCLSQAEEFDVEIFISHGCAFPFFGWGFDKKKQSSAFVNFEEVEITNLVKKVRPKYAVSGHNHVYKKEVHEGIDCIRLGHSINAGCFDVITIKR